MTTITARTASVVRLAAARLRHGRPAVFAARLLAGLILAEVALHSGAGLAAVAGTLAGIVTWTAFAIRGEFAPATGTVTPWPANRRGRPSGPA
jgi:hypothetical protein